MHRVINMHHKNCLHFGGMNPIAYTAFLKRETIPSIWYDCQHWELLPANDIEIIEAIVRYFSGRYKAYLEIPPPLQPITI